MAKPSIPNPIHPKVPRPQPKTLSRYKSLTPKSSTPSPWTVNPEHETLNPKPLKPVNRWTLLNRDNSRSAACRSCVPTTPPRPSKRALHCLLGALSVTSGLYRIDISPDPLKDPNNGTPQYEPITTLGN